MDDDNRGGTLNNAKSTGMLIDGALSVETPDSSGETVAIKGVDMASFDIDGIFLNYEHVQPEDKEKKGEDEKKTNGHELVGKLIYWKKIFKAEDCETPRQEMYFDKYNKVPYLYGIFRLFDGAGHDSAKALAAIIRDCAANNETINLRYSVEGSTLDRQKNLLTSTVVRAVAITKKPCNKAAASGLILDPNAPEGWKTTYVPKKEEDVLAGLLDAKKSEELHHPLYMPLGQRVEIVASPLLREADMSKAEELAKSLKLLFKAQVLLKTLTAGGGGAAAPSSLSGGAALGKESIGRSLKARALAAVRDYNAPVFDKGEFRAMLKAKLPEVDDSFINHFTGIAGDFHVKKSTLKAGLHKTELPSSLAMKLESLTVELRKASADLSEKKAPEVRFAGHLVQPGKATAHDGDYEILHEDDTHYTARPAGKKQPEDLVRLPKAKENTHFVVHQRPVMFVANLGKTEKAVNYSVMSKAAPRKCDNKHCANPYDASDADSSDYGRYKFCGDCGRESKAKEAARMAAPKWHLTDKADFKIDPNYRPQLAYGAGSQTQKPGLFLTDNPVYWTPWMQGKKDLYAVRVQPSQKVQDLGLKTNHPEFIDEDPANAKVLERLPIHEAIKKYPGELGGEADWNEYVADEDPATLKQTWKRRPGF